MQQTLVIGNWKMNGTLSWSQKIMETLVGELAGISEKVGIAVCPAYIHMETVSKELSKPECFIRFGAQNVHTKEEGAFTGEISAKMLSDLGATFVIVGHSERREVGETDKAIAEKFKLTQKNGLVPVLCVGESLVQRESGETERMVLAQLDAVIFECGIDALSDAIIAYEPIWAIGTGKTASADQAQTVHRCIRDHLAEKNEVVAKTVRIIYGGSVNSTNAKELFDQADIDGGLVGGASLKAEEFISICKIADY